MKARSITRHFDRWWRIIEKYRVNIFYTSPTAIRALIRQGEQWPNAHDLSSLRLLGSVGEPINPAAWEWYHRVIGKGRCPIVDTWWQTETGGIMIAPMPGAVPLKPGSGTLPMPGVIADIVDLNGYEVGPDQEGFLIIRRPWPGMIRTIWGDPERFKEQYWSRVPGAYFTGDAARRDHDGYYWVLGRVDDVMNVSGHRLSTMEVESALVKHPAVAEAAVVGKPHEITGQAVCCFVTLKKGEWDHDAARQGSAPVGGARNRQLRAARGDPLHRRSAQNPQRQNHAPPAAGNRDRQHRHRRRHHARGFERGDPARGAARRGLTSGLRLQRAQSVNKALRSICAQSRNARFQLSDDLVSIWRLPQSLHDFILNAGRAIQGEPNHSVRGIPSPEKPQRPHCILIAEWAAGWGDLADHVQSVLDHSFRPALLRRHRVDFNWIRSQCDGVAGLASGPPMERSRRLNRDAIASRLADRDPIVRGQGDHDGCHAQRFRILTDAISAV